jgi:hypothetical protein
MPEKFEQFAIVELMGRVVIAGLVSEQVIGGQSFVRVDVPATENQPAFTKFYGSAAIYCITPCDQAIAQAAVEGLRARPIDVWKLNLPQLSTGISHSYVDTDEDRDPRDEGDE